MNIVSPLGSDINYHPGSLCEQIDLEIKSRETQWQRISSLMLKYYHLCVTGQNPEIPVSYKELEGVYHDSQHLLLARRTFKIGNNTFLTTENAMKIVREYPLFWNHVQTIGYELRMLGDIPSTTLIFRDIIERTIASTKHKERFIGLDLGTGTGILLLALYILAQRNSCENLQLYGVSDSQSCVNHVHEIMKKIHCPSIIIEGDTTQTCSYDQVDIRHVAMVCNENIPHYTEGIHAEPFFHNIYALHEASNDAIDSDTHFFPDRVTIAENGAIVHDCGSSNSFHLDKIERDIKKSPDQRYSSIGISGKLFPLKDFHIHAAAAVGLPPCHTATARW